MLKEGCACAVSVMVVTVLKEGCACAVSVREQGVVHTAACLEGPQCKVCFLHNNTLGKCSQAPVSIVGIIYLCVCVR